MPSPAKVLEALNTKQANQILAKLYGEKPVRLDSQHQRYRNLITQFMSLFPERDDIVLFSTPGRSEVGGNHTDHNAGRVLAAAVDLDNIAVAARNDTAKITVYSVGYPVVVIDVNQLVPIESEKYTSSALIRGVCARMKELNYEVGGFDACVTSDVLKGSGLSSSAAYEVLIASMLNHYYNHDRIEAILLAQICQYAENNYFGKPCGLMDQTTCAVGGFVTIDFKDSNNPVVKKVVYDFSTSGYAMVIVDTGGNHADLTEDYTAVAREMKDIAKVFGGNVLREFSKEKVLENISYLRTKVNDRAILRAFHFYDDDQRVVDQVAALENNDFQIFLDLVIESGRSSWMLLQNSYTSKNVTEQGISIGLAVSQNLLNGRGAWRVHGGGFAGTIQAFVPQDQLGKYIETMRGIFGQNSCHELMIRQVGTTRLGFVD